MKIKKITSILIIITLLLVVSEPVLGIIINEIMYNPIGSDNNQEFIELFVNQTFPLIENYIVADMNSNDTLVALQIINSSFALIVEQGFNFTGINSSIYSAGATIGNNLDNDYDEIKLYDLNGTLIVNTSYNNHENNFANGNNKTLEFFNETFFESLENLGTPGRINSISKIFFNKTLNQTINNTFNNTNVTLNQTNLNLTNNLCNLSFFITTEKILYQNKEKIKYKFVFQENENQSIENYTITYWIEDLFEEIIKSKRETKNTNEKSYTPSINQPEKTLLIKSEFLFDNCTVSAEKIVVIQNKDVEFGTSSKDGSSSSKSSSKSGSISKTNLANKRIEYLVNDFKEINPAGKISFFLEIKNEAAPHNFEVWSYVYSGTKCVSCVNDREENIRAVSINAGKTGKVNLKNTVLTIGEYNLKIKIRKDNQKTTTDITKDIQFVKNENNTNSTKKSQEDKVKKEIKDLVNNSKNSSNKVNTKYREFGSGSRVVYESKSSRIKKLVPFFLLGAMMVLVICFIWTK